MPKKNCMSHITVSANYLLMKSRACALSCVALCMSANISISHTLSTVRLEHNASSHITLSLSRSYCKKKKKCRQMKITDKNKESTLE